VNIEASCACSSRSRPRSRPLVVGSQRQIGRYAATACLGTSVAAHTPGLRPCAPERAGQGSSIEYCRAMKALKMSRDKRWGRVESVGANRSDTRVVRRAL
jgi:hypothetical protein